MTYLSRLRKQVYNIKEQAEQEIKKLYDKGIDLTDLKTLNEIIALYQTKNNATNIYKQMTEENPVLINETYEEILFHIVKEITPYSRKITD